MKEKDKSNKKKKSKLARIGGIVTSVLAIAIVLICLGLIFTKSTDQIMFFGDKALMYVVSPSMEPDIPTGSFIVIEKVDSSQVQVGDVIVFISDDPSIQGSYNTHRVIEIIGDNQEFVTKGDNNANEDNYTAKAENVKGRYVRNAEVLSSFASWFMKPVGLAITIIVIIGVCCAVYVPDIVRGYKEDAARKEKIEKEAEIERIRAEALEEARAQLARQSRPEEPGVQVETPAPEPEDGDKESDKEA